MALAIREVKTTKEVKHFITYLNTFSHKLEILEEKFLGGKWNIVLKDDSPTCYSMTSNVWEDVQSKLPELSKLYKATVTN